MVVELNPRSDGESLHNRVNHEAVFSQTPNPHTPLNVNHNLSISLFSYFSSPHLHLTRIGWPEHCPDEQYKPYFQRRTELSVEQGCLLWGNRVVIPTDLRGMLLLDLHTEHMGMARMKAMARQYFWWPGIDKNIEDQVKRCNS